MKADKPLEWFKSEHFPNLWSAGTRPPGYSDGYSVVLSTERGDWVTHGDAGTHSSASLEAAQQFCQDHYNRQLRLKAWEDYMLTHEPPDQPEDV